MLVILLLQYLLLRFVLRRFIPGIAYTAVLGRPLERMHSAFTKVFIALQDALKVSNQYRFFQELASVLIFHSILNRFATLHCG